MIDIDNIILKKDLVLMFLIFLQNPYDCSLYIDSYAVYIKNLH